GLEENECACLESMLAKVARTAELQRGRQGSATGKPTSVTSYLRRSETIWVRDTACVSVRSTLFAMGCPRHRFLYGSCWQRRSATRSCAIRIDAQGKFWPRLSTRDLQKTELLVVA